MNKLAPGPQYLYLVLCLISLIHDYLIHSFFREFLLYLHKDTKIIDNDLILIEVDDKMSRNVDRPSGLDFYVGYVHGLVIC